MRHVNWNIFNIRCEFSVTFHVFSKLVLPFSTDLFVKAVPFDTETVQVNITWMPVNLKGTKLHECAISRNESFGFSSSVATDTKLDVRVQPLSSGDCSIRSCVAYGLPLVIRCPYSTRVLG